MLPSIITITRKINKTSEGMSYSVWQFLDIGIAVLDRFHEDSFLCVTTQLGHTLNISIYVCIQDVLMLANCSFMDYLANMYLYPYVRQRGFYEKGNNNYSRQ